MYAFEMNFSQAIIFGEKRCNVKYLFWRWHEFNTTCSLNFVCSSEGLNNTQCTLIFRTKTPPTQTSPFSWKLNHEKSFSPFNIEKTKTTFHAFMLSFVKYPRLLLNFSKYFKSIVCFFPINWLIEFMTFVSKRLILVKAMQIR